MVLALLLELIVTDRHQLAHNVDLEGPQLPVLCLFEVDVQLPEGGPQLRVEVVFDIMVE